MRNAQRLEIRYQLNRLLKGKVPIELEAVSPMNQLNGRAFCYFFLPASSASGSWGVILGRSSATA